MVVKSNFVSQVSQKLTPESNLNVVTVLRLSSMVLIMLKITVFKIKTKVSQKLSKANNVV